MNEETSVSPSQTRGIFDGPVIPVTLRLAAPLFIGMSFQLVYNFVDTFFVTYIDRSSTAIFSGVSLVFPVFFIVMSLAQCITVGVSSLVARAIGERNQEVLERTADSGFLLAVIMAVLALVGGYVWATPILNLLGAQGEVLSYARSYYLWILPGMGLVFIGTLFTGIIQGEGLTRPVMTSMIISTLINIALDPLFIFGLKMGVSGAALATVIAHTIGRLYIIVLFIRKRTRTPIYWSFRRARISIIKEIFRVGFPQSISMMAMAVSFMFFNRLVLAIGQVEFNAFALARRLDQIILTPIFAVASATITMVGQNYGRGNLARVKRIFIRNISLTAGTVLFISVFYVVFSPVLFKLFTDQQQVVYYASWQVRIVAFSFIGAVVGIISRATFQGTGSPLPAFILTIIRMGLVSVPLGFILVKFFGFGIYGIWYAIVIGNTVSAILSFIWVSLHVRSLKPGERLS